MGNLVTWKLDIVVPTVECGFYLHEHFGFETVSLDYNLHVLTGLDPFFLYLVSTADSSKDGGIFYFVG